MDVANLDDLEDENLFAAADAEAKLGQDGFEIPQECPTNTSDGSQDVAADIDYLAEDSIVVVLDRLRVVWKERRYDDSQSLLEAISKCLQPGEAAITPMVSFAHCRGMALLLDIIRDCSPVSIMSNQSVLLMRDALRMLEGWCDVMVDNRLMLLRLVNNDELNDMVSTLLKIIQVHGMKFGQNLVASSTPSNSTHFVLDALAVRFTRSVLTIIRGFPFCVE